VPRRRSVVANKKSAEDLGIEAAKRIEMADFKKKQDEATAARLAPYITEKDVYYVGEKNCYMMYQNEGGWKSYEPAAMAKLARLTSADDKEIFDDLLRATGRLKEYTVISFHKKPENILNFLSTEDWLHPTQGEYHPIFDIVMSSLSGGKQENRDHLEKCLVWKYKHPEDYKVPCITISGAGGVAKNEFVELTLSTIFGERQVIALGTEQAFGQYNGQMIGKTVVFIDEAIVEKSDAEALKRKVGNKTISINEKYGLQGTYENTPWYWLGGNGTNGAVMLAKDVTDRRYSVLTVKHSVMYWVCLHLAIDPPQIGEVLPASHEAVQWYQENANVLSDKEQVAKWLYSIVMKWWSQKFTPSALHSEDYQRVVASQKNYFDETMEYVFNDKFKHIEGATLYRVYQLISKEATGGQASMKYRNKFYVDTECWLEKNRPDIEWGKRKVKTSGGAQRVEWTTAYMYYLNKGKRDTLRNDCYYIMKDKRENDYLVERMEVSGVDEEAWDSVLGIDDKTRDTLSV
jgi:hypothetical protein